MWKSACKTKNALFIGQHNDLSRKSNIEINDNEKFKLKNLCRSDNMKNFYDFLKKIGREKLLQLLKRMTIMKESIIICS